VSARPLAGKCIVVTRPRHQASSLSQALVELGARVVEAPAIRIEPPADFAPLDGAIAGIGRYAWVVFTSANGVDAFFDRLVQVNPADAARELSRVCFAAIGPATAGSLRERGHDAAVIPERFVAEEVFRALQGRGEVAGKRFLLPRADIARRALPDLLRAAGARVDVVVAYRTRPATEEIARVAGLLGKEGVDVVTFTSASTARSFFSALDPKTVSGRFASASIGPITSKALRDLGVEPEIEAAEFTVPGLVEAIVRYVIQGRDRGES
jgi:uroporphyrinogen III methyltransferase / synthase